MPSSSLSSGKVSCSFQAHFPLLCLFTGIPSFSDGEAPRLFAVVGNSTFLEASRPENINADLIITSLAWQPVLSNLTKLTFFFWWLHVSFFIWSHVTAFCTLNGNTTFYEMHKYLFLWQLVGFASFRSCECCTPVDNVCEDVVQAWFFCTNWSSWVPSSSRYSLTLWYMI